MGYSTYPNVQSPQTKYLHRCNPSHCVHSPGFSWQIRRLVLTTTRLSGLIICPPTSFCRPSWMAILPSSKSTLRRTSVATVKLCPIFSSRRLKSKLPWLSHRVLMMNLEMISVILKRVQPSGLQCYWAELSCLRTARATLGYRETKQKLWKRQLKLKGKNSFFSRDCYARLFLLLRHRSSEWPNSTVSIPFVTLVNQVQTILYYSS